MSPCSAGLSAGSKSSLSWLAGSLLLSSFSVPADWVTALLQAHFPAHKATARSGIAGAVSRTATAPVDRVKLLLQVQDVGPALTIRDGFHRMASEGAPCNCNQQSA